MLFDELGSMGFRGYITFHHLSEAFLDKRLIGIARDARNRGMKPYVHTNGDVLRNDEALCREAAEVFEYIVVGLYDYDDRRGKAAREGILEEAVEGHESDVQFGGKNLCADSRPAQQSNGRNRSPDTSQCGLREPQTYLLIHYNGDVACCCEDMYGDLLRMNIFETSIREVWYSERHARLIKALKAGDRKQFALCTKCTMGPSHYSSNPMQATDHYEGRKSTQGPGRRLLQSEYDIE